MATPIPTTAPRLPDAAVQRLVSSVGGDVIWPDDPAYEEARRVFNGMIDRRPALIVRAVDAADVATAVRFAGEHSLTLSVRGGGHNVAGFGTNDGGLVLDLAQMRGVQVDPARRLARVKGGATWGDVDRATHAFGLATPGGVVSTTGVGGLTLGGGIGHLTRRFGLVCDNLLAAEIVTAEGRLLTVSAEEHPDLFWAIRGGGGNFGVVTGFEFTLHPVGTIYGGPIFYPVAESARVLRVYRDIVAAAPPELGAIFGYRVMPSASFVPEQLHGQTACVIVACWTGPLERAETAVRPIRAAGTVALDLMGPTPYPALTGLFDALFPPGLHHYWKADFVRELSDEAIAIHAEHGARVPSDRSLMQIFPLDGAVHEISADATAFSYRDVRFAHVISGVDADPAAMPARTTWVRDYWAALHPHAAGGAYVNFMMEEGRERVEATYRDNYPRLVEAKRRWDPDNLFRMNQNIRPDDP
jgi:FAD/FMN-containing dehydrogenase